MLIARAGEQRAGAAVLLSRVERATAWFERAKSIGRTLRANPLWVVGAVALVVAARPRRTLKLAATAYSLWKGWQNLRATLERFAPSQPPGAYRGL